jgi:hypothetical protein
VATGVGGGGDPVDYATGSRFNRGFN